MVTRESASIAGLRRSGWTRLKARITGRFGWAWQPLLYAGVSFGFLMGRAVPTSSVAPFGLAFYVAVRAAGFGGFGALAVALAVIAGTFSGSPNHGLQPVWVGAAVILAHTAAGVLRARPSQPRPVQAAVLAASVSMLPAILAVPRPAPVQVAFWAGLTGVMALIFTLGILDIIGGRFLCAGSSDLPVPGIVLVASALTGLDGLSVWGLSLHGLAAGLAVMACAYAGGLALGASAGAVLGIGFLFTTIGATPAAGPGASLPVPQAQAMAYVVAGFLAGSFRDLKKPGVGLSYALAFITYIMATQPDGPAVENMALSALAAVALFWAIPRQWLARLPVELVLQRPVQSGVPSVSSPLAQALGRLQSMSQVLKEVQRTFEQIAVVNTQPDPRPNRVFEQVTDRVCQACSMYNHCWHRDFDTSYQLFSDLWTQITEEGPLSAAPLPEDLEQRCIHPEQIAFTLNYLHDIDRSRRAFTRRLEEGRTIAGDYVRSVARLLDRMVDEVSRSGGRSPGNTAVYKLTSAVARLPKRGGHISGDSYEASQLSEGRYLLALSDGMGVGSEAAAQSKQCVRLLHQLLDAGFTTDVAVKTMNSVLLLRSPEESFATVDLALLDLGTGRSEFVKVGAAPSFIKRGSDVTVVKMPSVPVGIINQVEVEPEFRNLRPGDMIVMITDGIWDVSKDDVDKERWLIDSLEREQTTNPEELAERILARTLTLMPVPEDDLTVLVGKVGLIDGARGGVQPKPAHVSEWAPAQVAPRIKVGQPAEGKERRS